ncbi:serine/arginine-rich splicing factor 6-like [Mizuhopecten yessoensis]|uniref:serine/arginine-rich splicing factor 6-like n=1 Tax=Mizuhopecten yessoensis TaxID=6573 RepID=UPI000B45B75B|nr:serine/arginine-rich splicing factor 6-like [Mizuhopecten yessoensis]
MDLDPNPSKGTDLRTSPGPGKSHRSSRSRSDSEASDSPRERRKEKYRVKDDEVVGASDSPRSQNRAGFEGLCLGPGAYDNLTFKDDNGQLELTKIRAKDERARMNSKSKVLHKSNERLIGKGGNTKEHNGVNGHGNIYEKAPRSHGKSSTPNASPNKTRTSTTPSPSQAPKSHSTSFDSKPAVNGDAEMNGAPPPSPGGVVPDTPRSIQIPGDGNLQNFSVDEMSVFFRCMKVDELIIQRLKRKKMDGKRFSRLKDTDLEEIGIKNPIMSYFRDRSKRQRMGFML